MIQPTLSIIIPCYNCQDTLEEALMSILNAPPRYTFEIIIVDDKSTDSTWEVIQRLKETSPLIHIHQHPNNKGGGSARNTAVENSSGELIFCLDSDDLVTPNMLNDMIDFQKHHKLDGVGVNYSRKFKGRNSTNVVRTDTFSYTEEDIPFQALFETTRMNPLYSVFLHTREAFDIIGGYPENHGLDTQGFAFKFLANGFLARACPKTTYLHRLHFHKSYYTREYESGEINHSWLKIYEEFFYLWKREIQEEILKFPINDPEKNFHSTFLNKDPLDQNKKRYLTKGTKQTYKESLNLETLSPMDAFWLGCTEKNSNIALNYLMIALEAYKSPIILHHIITQLSIAADMSTEEILETIANVQKKTLQGSKISIVKRLIRKVKCLIKGT